MPCYLINNKVFLFFCVKFSRYKFLKAGAFKTKHNLIQIAKHNLKRMCVDFVVSVKIPSHIYSIERR